ncbi:hypothetical protein M8C21_006387 [Ambrosia artemisiifolia]|uniref:15-cis-phytoene synthase n=1 Tax=Ambrosia artemisiifolia TaxID=4212 RepID=A0AAD5BK35_AMBAR|nr:hypothetical protein M8C21_006387 [Ambrosia artemisiifolia]
MSAALFWMVSSNYSELCNGLGFLETTKLADLTKSRNFLRTRIIKNVGHKHKCSSCNMNADARHCFSNLGRKSEVVSRVVANPTDELVVSSEQLVYDVVLKQAALVKDQIRAKEDIEVKSDIVLPGTLGLLSEAYDRCGEVCAEYAKTFYLGTLLMTPERRKAIWAIYGKGLHRCARRGRVYLPQDELAQAGLSDEDIFAGKVTDEWRAFMKKQIKRARSFFDKAQQGVTQLSSASRWPVSASLLLYRQILDEIEANDYNNFTKRAYVSKPKKLVFLPVAYAKSLVPPS